MSTGPQLIRPVEKQESNWLPLAVAATLVVAVLIALIVFLGRGKGSQVVPATTAMDAYASSLPITNLAMSESANLAGGKVTYLDGHIANQGNRTVTGITVQVLFRNVAHEVAQNVSQQLMIIRTRDPYIDVETVSAAPLKPGDGQDFRLIFDGVSPNWDGAYPEIRIIQVVTK